MAAHRTRPWRIAALAALMVAGPGAWAAKIPGHALYADDEARVAAKGPVHLAVVGNVRPASMLGGVTGGKGDTESAGVIADLAAQKGLDALVLLGGVVRSGGAAQWHAFARRFAHVLAQVTVTAPPPQDDDDEGNLDLEGVATVAAPPPEPTVTVSTPGLPAVPVAGNEEASGDRRFRKWNGAFPGVGRFIGYNRVASWYRFDVASPTADGGTFTWRFLVLDSGRSRLGSRWDEELHWIPTAVDGNYDAMVVLMHDSVVDLAGKKLRMNPGGAPAQLVSAVDEAIGMMKLRAVFTAGHDASEAILPDGRYGELYVVAGGGGASPEDLRRWGPGDQAGRDQDLKLDPSFDMALQDAVKRWDRQSPLPEAVLDQARAQGSFKGFTGTYDGGHLPTVGWWEITLDGAKMDVDFHLRRPTDGKFDDVYRATLDDGPSATDRGAWKTTFLQVEAPPPAKPEPIEDLDLDK